MLSFPPWLLPTEVLKRESPSASPGGLVTSVSVLELENVHCPSPRGCWPRSSPREPPGCCLVCLWSVFPTRIRAPWFSGFVCFAHCCILSASTWTWHVASPQHLFTERIREEHTGKSISSGFCHLAAHLETPLLPPGAVSPSHCETGGKETRTEILKRAVCSWTTDVIYKAFDLENCWSHFQ